MRDGPRRLEDFGSVRPTRPMCAQTIDVGPIVGTRRSSSARPDQRRRRNAFAITETELRLIAALAIMGSSSQPVIG
jgi:hypothetical protein